MRFIASAILAAVLAFTLTPAHAGTDTILASAARTSTQTSADLVKTTEVAVTFVLVVSVVPGVDTLTLSIQGEDSLGNYYTILSSTASATAGTVTLVAGLGVATLANAAIGTALPDVYRVVVTHSGVGSFTYSLSRITTSSR